MEKSMTANNGDLPVGLLEERSLQEPERVASLDVNSDDDGSGHRPVSFPDLAEEARTASIESLGIYYNEFNGPFFIPDAADGWVRVSESGAKRYLRAQGFCGTKGEQPLSEIDSALLWVTQAQSLAYAGPLAGRKAGPFRHQGNLILATSSPTLIEPAGGDFPVISELLQRLLRGQIDYFCGWLKIAVESLRIGHIRQGQALVFAGPRNCGKSLVQNHIITPLLGGRSAKPYQFMSAQTQFNSDLFGAEHQMIEDEIPSADMRTRRNFGTMIKQFTATEEIRCHGKYKPGLTLSPFWRLTISCNDEPEDLAILPPLDESLSDKLILLKAYPGPMPMQTTSDDDRVSFRNKIASELPAFVDFLLTQEIPDRIRSPRYGVREYHNPEIVEAIEELSPEERLKELIDNTGRVFDADQPLGKVKERRPAPIAWEGTATQLEMLLRRDDTIRLEADKLFSTPKSCSMYLGKLVNRYPSRFKKIDRKNNRRRYRIDPPEIG
jgi:hypothetical protein